MKATVFINVFFVLLVGLGTSVAAETAPAKTDGAEKAAEASTEAAKKSAETVKKNAEADKKSAQVVQKEAPAKEKAAEPNPSGLDTREPDVLIKAVSSSILGQLKNGKGETKSLRELHELFSNELMPVVAIGLISRVVMASEWKKATQAQRAKFTKVFSTSLILFYAKAFAQYDNEPIKFLTPTIDQKKRAAMVPSEVVLAKGDPLSITYNLRQTRAGEWKVVDIIVGGVSLVASKQDEFRGLFNKEGLDSVIAKLEDSNNKALEG